MSYMRIDLSFEVTTCFQFRISVRGGHSENLPRTQET